MIAEFTPPPGKKLSVYLASGEGEVERIAAALVMLHGKGAEPCVVAIAPLAALKGVQVEETLGTTQVEAVDAAHRDLNIQTHGHLSTVVSAFLEGDALQFEAAQLESAVLGMTESGQYDFCRIAAKGKDTAGVCGSMVAFVGRSKLKVVVPEKPAA